MKRMILKKSGMKRIKKLQSRKTQLYRGKIDDERRKNITDILKFPVD